MNKSLFLTFGCLGLLGQICLQALEPTIQKIYSPAPATGQTPSFGKSVAMTERFILVGDPGDDTKGSNAGAAYLHDAKTGKRLRKLLANDGAVGDVFGTSVAVSGNLAIVGATGADSGRGAVYVFDLKKGTQINKLVGVPSDQEAGLLDLFGFCVALEGTTALIGSPGDDQVNLGIDSGSVYAMDVITGRLLTGPLNGERKIQADPADADNNDEFGRSVALSGNIAVIGAPRDAFGAKAEAGTVYMFQIRSGQRLRKVNVGDGVAGDAFGSSVAIQGDLILVGAPKSEVVSLLPNSGSAYLINFLNFTIVKKFPNPIGLPDEEFGSAVSLSGNLALVSAHQGVQRGLATGTAFLFDTVSGASLRSMGVQDASENALYGASAVLSGNQAVIGSPGDDDMGANAGAVYLFKALSGPLGVNTLAKKSDYAPGAPDTAFAGFSAYQVTPDAHVLLQATVSGTGASGGRTSGIWSRLGGSFDLALRTGDSINSSANAPKVTGLTNPVHTFFGVTTFYAKIKGPGITANNDEQWVMDNGTSVTTLVSEGNLLDSGEAIGGLGQMVNSSNEGMAAMIVGLRSSPTKAVSKANDSAALMFGLPGDTVVASVIEGTDSPIAGVKFGQVGPRITLDRDTAIVPAALVSGSTVVTAANNACLVQFRPGSPTFILARKGAAAPNVGGQTSGVFNAFLGECNSGFSYLIRASLTGVPTGENEGLWGNGINLLNLIAQKGKQVPQLATGIKYAAFLRYTCGTYGFTVLAKISGPGVSAANDLVLVHYPSAASALSGARLLMREGDFAPDGGGARIGLIQKVEVDRTSGSYAIITTLTDSDAASSQALWTGKLTSNTQSNALVEFEKPRLRLRRGSFQSLGSVTSALTTIDFMIPLDPTGAGGRGLGSPVGGNNVALVVTFANKQVIAGPLAALVSDIAPEIEPE
ncbi:FG-GAP repeat protein [Prosthecobacter fusiformis]|uniref:FG-GAP repeat protein n=1 Tax=Prosthecobacter fusiformis TaxID=48464 RepID=A0A4R7S585_9BACT|nr:FG-GAP repeat protein [Prosthecobacter fusiformis]TDU72796.1 FG-GAP repeat protein [Prosthecobacter fusiformis]